MNTDAAKAAFTERHGVEPEAVSIVRGDVMRVSAGDQWAEYVMNNGKPALVRASDANIFHVRATSIATEFPHFPADAVPQALKGDGWRDASWKNDVAPFFVHEPSGVGVWVDHPSNADRWDGEQGPRFCVVEMEWYVDEDAGGLWSHGENRELHACETPEELEAALAGLLQSHALAHAFAQSVESELADHLPAIRARNATPEYKGACATHDFCDANMLMADAFERVTGRPFLPEEGEPSDSDVQLWNAAWDIARRARLTGSAE